VEDEDVGDYGTDEGERQGNVAIDQEKDSASNLDRKNGDRVVVPEGMKWRKPLSPKTVKRMPRM
jgi:hypothetical protein